MTVTLVDRARGDVAPTGEAKADARMPVNMKLRINGREHRLTLDGRTTLLDALREHVGLTGTKKGCDHGQCGACTVLVGNRRVLSCLNFAMMAEGSDITTIEGLAQARRLVAPDATGFHRPRWVPMRLLHARSDPVSHRVCA
jgi:xanthine dehydrogenase YagT iron-sulfur-binding subunit